MAGSMLWFAATALACVAAWQAGTRLGRLNPPRAWLCVAGATTMLLLWAWLSRNPAVAVEAIPVRVLSRIEGVAAVPLFLLILGVAWARSGLTRQRAVVVAAVLVGVVHFVRGGGWMLQVTPAASFASTIDRDMVMQSQDFSCVAAASATALNRMGIYTSEAEMARLTRTTPGSGATIVRAMDGLAQRLAHTPWQPQLVQPTYDQLQTLPMPLLATVQSGPLQRHMIVVESANDRHVWVVDPAGGRLLLDAGQFAQSFTGSVIVFVSR